MKRTVAAMMVVFMLAVSLVGCSSGDPEDTAPDGNNDTVATPMDQETYLEKANGLNDAAGGFMAALQAVLSDPDNVDAGIEGIRATKEPFYEFAAIDNPPEGYEEVHSQLAASSQKFGDLINDYAELMQVGLDGTADADTYAQDSTDLMTEINTTLTGMGEHLTAVEAVAE